MSEMQKHESIERFSEGLKQAADRARMLGIAQKQPLWTQIATSLEQMRSNGMVIYSQKALTRQQALGMLDAMQGKMARDAG